jgi:D-3-phosphoglycerate dehydrogenase
MSQSKQRLSTGRPTVVLTDHPWPDVGIEQSILAAAGYELVAGPSATSTSTQVEAMIASHDPVGIMTCWAQVSAAAIQRSTSLRIVARMGVGLDNIAVEAATARGAWVTNVPDYCIEEVSDHVLALLLNAWRGITNFDREVKAGRWNPASARLKRASERTVGIIGYGRIGSASARKLAMGLRSRVLVTSPTLLASGLAGREIASGVWACDLDEIQRAADAIVLHAPLSQATRHLVDARFLSACQRQPLIVNVSRGGLIDSAALLAALERGQVSGAALDVVEGEPSPPPALVNRLDVTVTPHIAFSSDASIAALCRSAADDVVRALRGEVPRNPCNSPSIAPK